MADALSLSLFVSQISAPDLPYYYGLAAAVSFLVIKFYGYLVDRFSLCDTFVVILLILTIAFAATYALELTQSIGDALGAILFVLREAAYTIILVHFGTYLQQFFPNNELRRLLPLVYSGGRLGGLVGAFLLTLVVPRFGVMQAVPVFIGMMAVAFLLVVILNRSFPLAEVPSEGEVESSENSTRFVFLNETRTMLDQYPLVRWNAISGFLFMLCRWLLVFQYSLIYQKYFSDPEAMTLFLAKYTQVSLLASLFIQAVFVSRVVQKWGLSKAHLFYNLIMTAGFFLIWTYPGIVSATYCRFVESELRFSWRNPINQLVTNFYPAKVRVKARALTLGTVNPSAIFVAALALGYISGMNVIWVTPGLSVVLSGFYLKASHRMYAALAQTSLGKSA